MVKRELNNFGQPIIDANGDPVANLTIIFTLVDAGYNQAGTFDIFTHETIFPLRLPVVTDANGEFTIDLWPTSRGKDARYWLCEIRWPNTNRDFLTAPLAEDGNTPIQFYTWKLSAWQLTSAEISSFALHLQDASMHGGSSVAVNGIDYDASRIRNIKLMTTIPTAEDFDGPGSIILVYTP